MEESIRFLHEIYDYKLEIILDINEDAQILCNRIRLRKAIINVLKNAVEAAHVTKTHEKEITLSGRVVLIDKQKFYSISVINTGDEIPEKDMNRLFDPFFTTKHDIDAIGLGLTETYSIISSYGGNVTAQNEKGKVVFTLTIPL